MVLGVSRRREVRLGTDVAGLLKVRSILRFYRKWSNGSVILHGRPHRARNAERSSRLPAIEIRLQGRASGR